MISKYQNIPIKILNSYHFCSTKEERFCCYWISVRVGSNYITVTDHMKNLLSVIDSGF